MTDRPIHNLPADGDIRRKRLRFRSWHRGTREMDLVLGGFADRHLNALSAEELDAFERLLSYADPDIYNWIVGHAATPPDVDTALVARIRSAYLTDRQ